MACFTEIKAHDTKDDQSQADELQGGGGFAKVQYPDYGYQSHIASKKAPTYTLSRNKDLREIVGPF